jgi:hypothetical protein
MRPLRCISLPTHALLELVAGLALTGAALAIDLGTAGALLTFAAGVLMTGIGLGAADAMPVAAHESLDRLLATGLAAASIAAALGGSPGAAALLLAAGAVELALGPVTRWRRTPLA